MIIKTGIFWFVCGEMIADRYDYDIQDFAQKDFIDYPYSHFDMWDKLSKNRWTYADFATFPRGRLLYCVKEGRYYLYLDRCITEQQTDLLLSFYNLGKDEVYIARDEHYSCDKCCRKIIWKGKTI